MTFTISDFQDRLASKIHSANIDQVGDIYGLILEGAGNLLSAVDPRSTKRTAQITNALYDQVYNYIAPTDLKGSAIIDVRPQGNRATIDNLHQTSTRPFNRFLEGISVEDNTGVRTLKIAGIGLTAGSTVNECDSVTTNGTWAVGGNASGLIADPLNKLTGSASLKFDITAGGTSSYIENSTMTALDLSAFENAGALFVNVYIPSITIVTSVTLRWGSSSSDYYSVTVTATQDNTAFVVGWNTLRFDWNGLTPTGTPVDTAIDYLRVTFGHTTSATTSCRVDSIVARIGSIYLIDYYSKYLFRTSGGTWIEKPTTGTDIINLDVDEFNLLLYEVAELVAFELQKADSSFDVKYWTDKKKEVWGVYSRGNKSQVLKKQSSYYPQSNNRRR